MNEHSMKAIVYTGVKVTRKQDGALLLGLYHCTHDIVDLLFAQACEGSL